MGIDSATDLKPIDAVKVRAIASRLASDHDGEVVAAARALVRIAAAAGKRVEDLVAVPVPDYLNQPMGQGWRKTWHTDAMFADLVNDAQEWVRRGQSKKPNWKFIVDGLCLVGRSGLLNLSDQAMLGVVRGKLDESPGWTPPALYAAHILELARRHGIVAA